MIIYYYYIKNHFLMEKMKKLMDNKLDIENQIMDIIQEDKYDLFSNYIIKKKKVDDFTYKIKIQHIGKHQTY